MLKEGSEAPEFTLKDQNGEKHSLSHYKGYKVILYFYPKDNTPGCTQEAQAFRDDYNEFKKRCIVVLGVSKDSESTHKNFADNHKLPFTLLSDPEGKVIEKYGAWKEKSMYGKTFMGIARITYIIDEKGKILKAFPKVKPKEHTKEILDALWNHTKQNC